MPSKYAAKRGVSHCRNLLLRAVRPSGPRRIPHVHEASTADRLGRIECRTATQAATGVCHRAFDLTSVDVLGEP